jgi:hypothetical protein
MKRLCYLGLTLSLGACALRLGGPKPVEYDAAAVRFESNATPAAAAAQLRTLGIDLALVLTPNDSAWLRQVAQQAQLTSTRPGRIGDLTAAFLAFKPQGDTTLVLNVPSGGRVLLHDALYNIDKERRLDLMTAVIESGTSTQGAVRSLLEYVATDVMSVAVGVLAVQAPSAAVVDSVALLTRAVWADAWECTEAGRRGEPAPPTNLRLFYFPAARVRCEQAQVSDNGSQATVARLIVR